MSNSVLLEDVVDELGEIKAQISDLAKREDALKKTLRESGLTEINGRVFRATVAEYMKATLDMDAVREKLSPQFIASHTKKTNVTTIKVIARTRARVA